MIVHVAEGMERDAVLRDEGEIGIGEVVEEGGGEEAAGGGDEGRGGALGFLGGDEAALEDAAGRGDGGGGVGVDVDVVEVFVVAEEEFPERGEMEIGVGEEEEGDLGFRSGGAVEGGEGGAAEEGEVVELVGERDLDVLRREKARDEEEEEEERKRKQERE